MKHALTLAALLTASPVFAQSPQPGPDPAPTPTPTPAPAGKPTVAALLDALKAAPSEEAAAVIEGQLRSTWIAAASPAIRLLLSRGRRELSEGSPSDSLDSYDAALDMDPNLIEAWRGRATARLHSGDTTGAVKDLEEVIKREPHDFDAWDDLSRIAESRSDWRAAYAAWQKLLEFDPKTPGGQDRLKELRRHAVGEDA
jgi:tetratricopeptide (TPR) repeat protein